MKEIFLSGLNSMSMSTNVINMDFAFFQKHHFFTRKKNIGAQLETWDPIIQLIMINGRSSGSNRWRYVNVPYNQAHILWGYSLKFRPQK